MEELAFAQVVEEEAPRNEIDLEGLRRRSAFCLFPELIDEVLKSAEIKKFASDSKIVEENGECSFIFMSLDHCFERSMRVGNFNDSIFVSDVEPFEFMGFTEALEKKKFLMSYSTQDMTNFLTISKEKVHSLFSDPVDLRRFRLLNSSKALREFFFFLLDHGVERQTLHFLLDQIPSTPRMFEKRSRVEFASPQIVFIQSGAITGRQSLQTERHNFVFTEGTWFGKGIFSSSGSQETFLETVDTVYFHSLPISVLESHLSPELLQALAEEPCLVQEPVSGPSGLTGPLSLTAKSMSLDKLKMFGFGGDIQQIRYGGFPLSPHQSTLWNFLVLFGQELNESYISKVSDTQGSISLSRFASSLEDMGLLTNLRRYYHESPEVIPANSLIFFYGRPVIYLKSRLSWVFLLDPVYGLIAIKDKYFFRNWNKNLVEVKRPAVREVLGDESKVGMERAEYVGRKLLKYFMSKCSDEIRNLMTFKFFQTLATLAIPSFLFGLVHQSIGNTNTDHIYVYYLGIGLFLVFQAVSIFSLNVYSAEIMAKMKTQAQSYFYKLYLSTLSSPLMPLRSGYVYSRLSLLDFAFSALKFEQTELILYSFMIFLFLLILSSFSWPATFVILVATAMSMAVIYYLRKRGGFTEVNTAVLRQDVIDSFVDIVQGIRSIRTTHTMSSAEAKINQVVRLLNKGSGEYTISMIGINHKGLLIFKVGGVLALYIVCKELLGHRSSPAELFGLTLYLSYLNSPFTGLSSYFTSYNTSGLFALPGQLALSQGIPRSKSLRTLKLQGAVQFERVSFRYSERSPFSVIECSFKISPGERVAIVGRSGSGKSTLVRLIARQIEPTGGKILYDDTDSRLIEPASVQSQVGFAPQVATLFAGSLVANVAFGEDDFQIQKTKELCRATHAHRFVKNLPGDYSYTMKEFGNGLSAGQKQVMALTRVLYSDPEILILDEVTANLDPQSEGFVTEKVFERKQHRTIVMVVQKISAARRADRILVMKHGRIIEEGDHNRLMSLGGEYSELYRHQVSDDL